MKPEFSEVLIPASKLQSASSTESTIRLIGREKSSETMNKCFITAAIAFAFVVAIVTTAFIVRYEDKLSHYEFRISSLEKDLSNFYELWEEEYGPMHVAEKDFEYELPPVYGSDENVEDEYSSKEDENQEVKLHEDKDLVGDVTVEEAKSRRKRQIPIPTLPTYGPEVQRTADGVPILESSYLDRTDTRPAAAAFARFSEPATTTDSEGLRLYEGLLATGGRNEPRSLDSGRSFGQNGILPHHRTSASWTERNGNRNSRSHSGIQLKSGDSTAADLPSGFGASTGAQIGEDLTYGRASSYRRHTRTEKTRSSSRGSSSTTSSRSSGDPSLLTPSSSLPAVTYHRRSRVPATDDFLIPPATSQLSTRSLQYPPLQTFGRGDGEVIARVVQNDNEADSEFPNGQSVLQENNRRRQGSRRVSAGNSKRQAAFKQGRKQYEGLQEHQHQHYPLGRGSGDISIVKAEAWVESPGKPVAAHYSADVTGYNVSHRHYEGNGRLRNVDGIFASWKPSEWMESTTTNHADGEEKNFVLNQNGVLTVKKPGLYYIYAQIHYLDEHDINGYVVQVNTHPFLQCTTMTETQHAGSKSNSCFTAGITQLKENDRILIKDIETNRYSIFKPEKSFFGLMKIGDLQ